MSIHSTEEAIAQFCTATTKHAEASETGEYKVGNAAYAQIIEALRWLKDNQETQLLYPLLTALSIGTQLWAATYLLTTGNLAAEAVLLESAQLDSIHGFNSKITLQEWRAGRLQPLI